MADALEEAVNRAAEKRRQQKVRMEERKRCANIARFAGHHAADPAVKHKAVTAADNRSRK